MTLPDRIRPGALHTIRLTQKDITMPYIPTAPTTTEIVVQSIRDDRRAAGGRYYSPYGTDRRTVGQFTAVGGATVEVRVLVRFGEEYPTRDGRPAYGEPKQRVIRFGATAACHGHGCPDPSHEQPHTHAVPLDSGASDEELADGAEGTVRAAREWAQAHAEKCRAMPYRG